MGEHRQITRDSLFVMAEVRVDGVPGEQRVRVRNLSAGGLMAENVTNVHRGMVVWVNVRNIGWVEGSIAWLADQRCGIAFRDEIDPKVARAATPAEASTLMVRRPVYAANLSATDPRLRKI